VTNVGGVRNLQKPNQRYVYEIVSKLQQQEAMQCRTMRLTPDLAGERVDIKKHRLFTEIFRNLQAPFEQMFLAVSAD
jgi:hypothetical protein